MLKFVLELCQSVMGEWSIMIASSWFNIFSEPAELQEPAKQVVRLADNAISKNSPMESLVPMVLGLVAILTLIFVLAAILKRFSQTSMTNQKIKVVECFRIGTKEKLLIVQVENENLLLGVTPQNINLIKTLDAVSKTELKTEPKTQPFQSMMTQLLGRLSPESKVQSNNAEHEAS